MPRAGPERSTQRGDGGAGPGPHPGAGLPVSLPSRSLARGAPAARAPAGRASEARIGAQRVRPRPARRWSPPPGLSGPARPPDDDYTAEAGRAGRGWHSHTTRTRQTHAEAARRRPSGTAPQVSGPVRSCPPVLVPVRVPAWSGRAGHAGRRPPPRPPRREGKEPPPGRDPDPPSAPIAGVGPRGTKGTRRPAATRPGAPTRRGSPRTIPAGLGRLHLRAPRRVPGEPRVLRGDSPGRPEPRLPRPPRPPRCTASGWGRALLGVTHLLRADPREGVTAHKGLPWCPGVQPGASRTVSAPLSGPSPLAVISLIWGGRREGEMLCPSARHLLSAPIRHPRSGTDFVKDPERALPSTALGSLSAPAPCPCHLCPSSEHLARHERSPPLAASARWGRGWGREGPT